MYDLGAPLAARRGINALFAALQSETSNEFIDISEPYDPLPPKCWPSTIDYINENCGGFYGMSTLTAEKGTGKTMIAVASAIEAAASGFWQVVLFLAEDDYDGFRERFNLYLASHPGAHDCFGNLHLHAVGRGQTPETLSGDVASSVDYQIDTPVLVVIDSINSVVNLARGNYLAQLKEFSLWAMFSRRLSHGDVSFLITAETNKAGEAKGEGLQFWSDLYLKMKKKSNNVVEMRLDKTRRTPGEGDMGKYLRHWSSQTFRKAEAVERELRVVHGGRDYFE